MGQKGMDFKRKEVISIKDGKRLGFVQDVCADLETGTITSIIVPGSNKFLNIISSGNDIVIQWQNIKCIGAEAPTAAKAFPPSNLPTIKISAN